MQGGEVHTALIAGQSKVSQLALTKTLIPSPPPRTVSTAAAPAAALPRVGAFYVPP